MTARASKWTAGPGARHGLPTRPVAIACLASAVVANSRSARRPEAHGRGRGGATLLAHVLGVARACPFEQPLCVLGSDAGATREQVDLSGVELIADTWDDYTGVLAQA